jgi:hypothetical protein
VRITKEVSVSRVIEPGIAGMPDPEWIPIASRQLECRTFWIRTQKPPFYEQVTICLRFDVLPKWLPDGPTIMSKRVV